MSTYCAFEQREFPSDEFDADGFHKGRHPRHNFNGEIEGEDPIPGAMIEAPEASEPEL